MYFLNSNLGCLSLISLNLAHKQSARTPCSEVELTFYLSTLSFILVDTKIYFDRCYNFI